MRIGSRFLWTDLLVSKLVFFFMKFLAKLSTEIWLEVVLKFF